MSGRFVPIAMAYGQCANTETIVYTVTGFKYGYIRSLVLFNTDTVSRDVEVWLNSDVAVPSTPRQLKKVTLAAKERLEIIPPGKCWILPDAGHLALKASVAATVNYYVSGVEEDMNISAGRVEAKGLRWGQMLSTQNGEYAVSTGQAAYIHGISLYNTDTVSRLVQVWMNPVGTSYLIYEATLTTLQSVEVLNAGEFLILPAGGWLEMKAAAAAVVNFYVSGAEETL